MTNTFFYIWSIVFGLVFGSFANVLILRDQKRKSILTGRSKCPKCQHLLAWFDLVPILSFLSLKGKCRYCQKNISWQYPLVELASALLALFAIWYGEIMRLNLFLAFGLYFVCLLLLVISVIDILSLELPLDYAVGAAIIGGFVFWLSGQNSLWMIFLGILAGAGIIFGIFYGWKLLFKEDGMGMGDIWLAGSIGAILGYPLIIIALLGAVFLGAIMGIIFLGFGKKGLKTALPFGPFLSLGLIFALIWGKAILTWYGIS